MDIEKWIKYRNNKTFKFRCSWRYFFSDITNKRALDE